MHQNDTNNQNKYDNTKDENEEKVKIIKIDKNKTEINKMNYQQNMQISHIHWKNHQDRD